MFMHSGYSYILKDTHALIIKENFDNLTLRITDINYLLNETL